MRVWELCPRRALACRRDATADDAAELLREHGDHELPVVDARGRVLGILSAHAIARALESDGAALAGEIMDRVTATCLPSDDVRQLLPLLGMLGAHRLPIVDDRGLLWGMIALEDILCRAAAGADPRELPPAELIDAFCRVVRGERPRLAARPGASGSDVRPARSA